VDSVHPNPAAHYVVQVSGTQNYTFTPAEFTARLEQRFGG